MTIYIVCYIPSEFDDEILHYDKAYLKLENAEKMQANLKKECYSAWVTCVTLDDETND
jgi:hypothetical protein